MLNKEERKAQYVKILSNHGWHELERKDKQELTWIVMFNEEQNKFIVFNSKFFHYYFFGVHIKREISQVEFRKQKLANGKENLILVMGKAKEFQFIL